MLKLSNSFSKDYPHYEFNGVKFIVRDQDLKFYSDAKRLESEFYKFLMNENYNFLSDVVSLSDSFERLINNMPEDEYEKLKDDPNVVVKVKDKVLEYLVNNKEDAEIAIRALIEKETDFNNAKDLFLCDFTIRDDKTVSNTEITLKTFLKSDDFDKIDFNCTGKDLFNLIEFTKIVLNDFFLFFQKLRAN